MVRWIPLESNPEVMNKFLDEVGVDSSTRVHDVFGLEPELLAMVPQPAHALLLLYPLTEQAEAFRAAEDASLKEAGSQEVSDKVYFMKQFVGNACGTVALLHAVANCTDRINLKDGPLKEFLEKSRSKTPDERGKELETVQIISSAHESCAAEGQTEAPDRDEKLTTHFIAFVNVDGHVYELDGRKSFPIKHCATTHETFLQDTAAVVRGFMNRETGDSRFAMCAMAAAE